MLRRTLAFAAVLASAACSSSPSDPTGGGGSPSDGTTGAKYTFSFTTAPGKETHWCQYMKMPEAKGDEVLVTGYSWKSENMHHWSLYKTTTDLPSDVSFDQPFDCFAPGAMKYAAPATFQIGASDTGDQSFPEGTGFGSKPGEVVLFQAHTLNTSTADLHPTIDFTIKLGDPAQIPNRLGFIQFYDPYIYVPAHMPAKAQMRCAIPQDITIVQGATHQHTRGTEVAVFTDTADGVQSTTPILDSHDWEHPSVSNDVFKLAKGSHVRTVCNYLGDDHDTIQGQDKLDNEMCMYLAYYYPAVPAEMGGAAFEGCISTPFPGGVGDGYGTGAASCLDTLACIQACPAGDAPMPGDGRIDVGACWQRCLVDSCAQAAAPLDALTFCVANKCATACSGSSTDCNTCVASNCAAEYVGCQSTACGG